MKHRGTRISSSVPYVRRGLSKVFKKIRRTYIQEHAKVAADFNRSTARRVAGMKKLNYKRWR